MTERDDVNAFAPLLYSPHDEPRYEEMARRALAALDTMHSGLHRLAAVSVEGHSRDGRVSVRVTGSGEVIEVRLRGGALLRYNSVKLGEVVTRTLRATQQQARAAYERAASEVTAPEVAETERLLRRTEHS